MKQLDLFSIPIEETVAPTSNIVINEEVARPICELPKIVDPDTNFFEINDTVKVSPPDLNTHGVEDYYYLKEFACMVGRIIKINNNLLQKLSYEVDFSGRTGIFYREDLQLQIKSQHPKE
jgi:hypothetical protein